LRKGCGKNAESLAENLKPLISNDFTHFIPHISLMQKCIEKISFSRGGVGGGLGRAWGRVFSAYAEMRKEIHQVLDFQRFALFRNSFRILSASFPQCGKSLTFNALPTSSKCLSLNGFTHLYDAGGWVKGRVLSKG